LIRGGGQQFRFDVVGTLDMSSALLDAPVFGCKKTIHSADRAVVVAFIKQRSIYLIRGIITEALGMKSVNYHLALSGFQPKGRCRPVYVLISGLARIIMMPVECSPWHHQSLAGGLFADMGA